MIAVPVPREQWHRVARAHQGRDLDAREQLADYLDSIAAGSGDAYFAGLADGLRLRDQMFVIAPRAQTWN